MKILVLNSGSSSLKCCLYDFAGGTLPKHPAAPLWEKQIDSAHLKIKTANNVLDEKASNGRSESIAQVLKTLWNGKNALLNSLSEIDIVGHRVVHGGSEYRKSTFDTPEVKATIARLADLAPAHNPAALRGITVVEELLGESVPQLAAFDTAFHHTLPDAAAIKNGHSVDTTMGFTPLEDLMMALAAARLIPKLFCIFYVMLTQQQKSITCLIRNQA